MLPSQKYSRNLITLDKSQYRKAKLNVFNRPSWKIKSKTMEERNV